MDLPSILESSSGEERWIKQVSKILEKEVMIDIDVPVSIFRAPAALSAFKPQAYVPRLVGLGPYHHFRSELYEMERCKLAAAGRLQKMFRSIKFEQLVDKLEELEQEVRACYHKYLDIEGHTLSWIMAIDGLFLIDFIYLFTNRKDETDLSSTTTAVLVDCGGKKLASDDILGDMLMLENQVPIFVLSKILSVHRLPESGEDILPSNLMRLCKALSPLKLKENVPLSEVLKRAHLLDLLHHLTVPKLEVEDECRSIYVENDESQNLKDDSQHVFAQLWSYFSGLNVGFVRKITKPIGMIISLPGKIASNAPVLSNLGSKHKEDINPEVDQVCEDKAKSTPMVEEINVPSVSQLCDIGFQFCPTSGGITSIKLDLKKKRIYLPVVTLDVHSEVIMRNLVAYEATALSECLVFTRYTELMKGIIDTAEDTRLLREKKIIVNHLKSDAEVADIFNGMSKSIRCTHVPYIDKFIENVNKNYHNTPKIRARDCMKKYVYRSWKLLTLIGAFFLMLLVGLQSFCSVYGCRGAFHSISGFNA
ncbi:putative UPF0481 protein At3g02645 [Diospyros lotus]|uniref:putative UPF0481 protein At3g02645 n=1 Tax=Diospyros lotus TaxID=55363 RepID=UPI002251D8BD|nr:putative UPF0481 protein At3g02645 [Diospyros lotus]